MKNYCPSCGKIVEDKQSICDRLGLDKETVKKIEKLFNQGQVAIGWDIWTNEYRLMTIRKDGGFDATGSNMRDPVSLIRNQG
jgi:hypothetical protein